MTKIQVGDRVTVSWGRNKGEVGRVGRIDQEMVFIDFSRMIVIAEGSGSLCSYMDGYWSNVKYVEKA